MSEFTIEIPYELRIQVENCPSNNYLKQVEESANMVLCQTFGISTCAVVCRELGIFHISITGCAQGPHLHFTRLEEILQEHLDSMNKYEHKLILSGVASIKVTLEGPECESVYDIRLLESMFPLIDSKVTTKITNSCYKVFIQTRMNIQDFVDKAYRDMKLIVKFAKQTRKIPQPKKTIIIAQAMQHLQDMNLKVIKKIHFAEDRDICDIKGLKCDGCETAHTLRDILFSIESFNENLDRRLELLFSLR